MRQNPDTGAKQTLEDSVNSPQGDSRGEIRNRLRCHIVVEDIESDRQTSRIPSHIVQTSESGALIAVRRDGITNVLDCVVRNLELVAVRVEHLALARFRVRSHGRQRRRRRRGTRTVNRGH